MKYDPETPCKIDATFHDWRTVKGRKMLQLIFEVPLDEQGDVLTLLGQPDPMGSKWCMIALKNTDADLPTADDVRGILNPQASEASGQPKPVARPDNAEHSDQGPWSEPPQVPKPKRKFSDLSLPEQAGIRCGDGRFQRFLEETYGVTFPDDSPGRSAQVADRFIKTKLGIQSKRELLTDDIAADWRRVFDGPFQEWLTDQEHGGSINR